MKIIGLMSGTSADGIDVALCEIDGRPPQLEASILETYSEAYSDAMRSRILEACQLGTSSVDSICVLNFDLAEITATVIDRMLSKAQIAATEIDLISLHGQTIWHNVVDGTVTATLQITSASVLAERTGITVVSNFRERDVAAGGQGAPLTGYADWLLLRHPSHWRAVQNIGGMGNVTFLPPLSDTESASIAFDTGPGNALIDIVAHIITDGKQTYDHDGKIAAKGQIQEEWLAELLDHSFFDSPIPKTTGRELFGSAMAHQLVNEGRQMGLRDEDILATVTMLTAASIAKAYEMFAPRPIEEIILGGGGRHNKVLLKMLRDLVGVPRVLSHEDIGLDSDFKEALVFALLAHETWHGRVGTLPSQTGARHATVLGEITPGNNYSQLIQTTWCRTT